jgi:hypothetical protein
LAGPGSKATGDSTSAWRCGKWISVSLRSVGTTSFVGSATSSPAGVGLTVSGCTKIASGVLL